jgi:hypothetical protein
MLTPVARRALAGVVFAGIVLAGCTAASRRAESFDMEVREDFEDPETPTIPRGAVTREAAQVPATNELGAAEVPVEPPRLRLLPHDRSGCGLDVEAHGWPAMRADGGGFAFVNHPISAGADIEEQPFTIDTEGTSGSAVARDLVYDGATIQAATHGAWGAACDAARRDITARIEAINAKFASWRPMTRVPVQDPWRIDGGPALPQPTADLHRRPVEALYHGGHFVARVPGVKVLQSIPMPWRGEEPTQTMGASDPTIMALYVDPPTGFAVAELSYESASCMSDPTIITRPVAVAPEVLTEAAARAAFVLSEPVDG